MSGTSPYVCGKCSSGSLYREDDAINGAAFIACRICGNRWPGGFEPRRKGTDCKSVPELPRTTPIIKEENKMEPIQKDEKGRFLKVCTNCHELKVHHGRGLCSKCYGVKVLRSPTAGKPRLPFVAPIRPVPAPAGLVVDNKSNGPSAVLAVPAVESVIPARAEIQPLAAALVSIAIPDTARNRKVWASLCAEAEKCRRTPTSQILWTLETLMESEA